MEKLANDLFDIFRLLLPGFLAAWIFYGFSAHEKGSQFERIIQALIFTLFVQFAKSALFIIFDNAGVVFHRQSPNFREIEDVINFIFAGIVGFTFAYFANRDILHKLLRTAGLTDQTSYPSEWFGVFSTQKMYVVLHLEDERRLFGWPKEWPQSPEYGHFFIVEPSWQLEGGKEEYLGDDGVAGMLIAASDVKWVEFVKQKESD